jgi:hypothetical protein
MLYPALLAGPQLWPQGLTTVTTAHRRFSRFANTVAQGIVFDVTGNKVYAKGGSYSGEMSFRCFPAARLARKLLPFKVVCKTWEQPACRRPHRGEPSILQASSETGI